MFSSTQTTILVALLAVAVAASTAPALASSTSTATATTTPTASNSDPALNIQPDPGNNTTVAEAGYGILEAARGQTENTTAIARELAPGFVVEDVEYRDGFALVTVINSRPETVRLTVTDANSIKTGGGSFVVAQEQFTLPSGRFELKVPASSARGGDQTITLAAPPMEYPIGFSDTSDGGGQLRKVGSGALPWALGGATAFTYVIGVAYVVLSGERTGVREAGGTV
jgi:hypothetical protein